MGKRLINGTIFSIVVSIVLTVGSYTCKGSDPETQMVVVQHPDSCILLSPKPLASGAFSSAGDIVNVQPGSVKFEFDCDGNDVTVTKTVKEGQLNLRIDPTQR